MQKNKGITLVALVVTIIVLLIIAGVSIAALTGDNGIVSKAQEAANNEYLESIKEEIKLQILGEMTSNDGVVPTNDILKSILEKYGTLQYEEDGVTVKGVVTTEKDYEILLSDLGIKNTNSSETHSIVLGAGGWNGAVNSPKLTTGMTGIYWDELGNEVTVTTDNQGNWYDYTNKKWANAKTLDGSYFVWIPRYEYKIPTPHTNTAQTIDVKFIQDTNLAVDTGYTLHPAFTFGTTEVTGIWIAKFEASGTTSAVDVKPNVSSLRSITIDTMFTACRNIETNTRYGWNSSGADIDSHLMKNVEWGAVSYLSSSQYGKSGEIWINPNSNYITGQAGTNKNAISTISTFAYTDLTYGVNANTTGNIYGIYDMNGCAYEYVAAYVNNGNSSLTTYGSSLVNADLKYKDVYVSNGDVQNYEDASSKIGDAVYETSSSGTGLFSWYGDYSSMPYSSSPFFGRGGYYNIGAKAGTFAFNFYSGVEIAYIGFRPVLVVTSGL